MNITNPANNRAADFEFKKNPDKDDSFQLLACDDDVCRSRTEMYVMLSDAGSNTEEVPATDNGGAAAAVSCVSLLAALHAALFM